MPRTFAGGVQFATQTRRTAAGKQVCDACGRPTKDHAEVLATGDSARLGRICPHCRKIFCAECFRALPRKQTIPQCSFCGMYGFESLGTSEASLIDSAMTYRRLMTDLGL